MKTRITKAAETNEELFPALYEHKNTGYVVLFTENATTGVVVSVPEGFVTRHVGDYETNWTNCFTQGVWARLLPGSKVELIQE